MNRTCAAGLRHSVKAVQSAKGFEVPNVGHNFACFSCLFFSHICRFKVTIPPPFFFNACSQGGLFQAPMAASSCSSFTLLLCFKASQPTARALAEPSFFFFCLSSVATLHAPRLCKVSQCPSAVLCVGNRVTKGRTRKTKQRGAKPPVANLVQ